LSARTSLQGVDALLALLGHGLNMIRPACSRLRSFCSAKNLALAVKPSEFSTFDFRGQSSWLSWAQMPQLRPFRLPAGARFFDSGSRCLQAPLSDLLGNLPHPPR